MERPVDPELATAVALLDEAPNQKLIDLMAEKAPWEPKGVIVHHTEGPDEKSRGLGSMMAGGVTEEGREKDDFYATPVEATQAGMLLMDRFLDPSWRIHEPCCGDGKMAEVIKSFGYHVVSTDLEDRGYIHGHQIDYFRIDAPLGDVGITNPPFSLAEAMLRHALEKWKPKVFAMLLKSTWFHADERQALFHETKPRLIGALPWRLDFKGLGRPTMECSWFVWVDGYDGPCEYTICENLNPKKRKNKTSNPA